MAIYILLHQKHGPDEWMLLAEGSAETVQGFLDGNGCRKTEHYRVIVSERNCLVEKPVAEAISPVFYVSR